MSLQQTLEHELGHPDCPQCGGHGSWTQYLHGTDPKYYPVHECRVCRVLEKTVREVQQELFT